MLGLGGWLSWQALKGLMPWAPPWLGYGLAVLAVAGLIGLYGYHLGARGLDAAVAERDLEWIKEIGEQNYEMEREAERVRLAGDDVAPTPADRDERMRLCAASPTCRDNR